MKIKYVITKYTSKRDRSGNCYTLVNLVETETGKSIWIDTGLGQGDNIRFFLRKNGIEFGEYLESQNMVPIREFATIRKLKLEICFFEHELTPDLLSK